MILKIIHLSALAIALTACSISMNPNSDDSNEPVRGCAHDDKLQTERTTELQKIVDSDQKERADFQSLSKEQVFAMYNHDIERRKRVGEIFGEGCFKTAADFANAALVFQHGITSDHFYQSYIWARRAVELGDASKKEYMANAIDRYLVTIGQKQLFGSQAHADKLGSCYCMQEIEKKFPESKRIEYKGKTLAESMKWIDKMNIGKLYGGKPCGASEECAEGLKPAVTGEFPGIW